LVLALGTQAQEFQYVLFDRSKGFNRNQINDICRDSLGFFWLATDRGILRFDGNNISEFPHPGASSSSVLHLRSSGKRLFLVYDFEGVGEADLASGSFRMLTRRRTADLYVFANGDRLVLYADGMLVRYRSDIAVDSVMQSPGHTAEIQVHQGRIIVKTEKTGVNFLDSATLAPKGSFNPRFNLQYRLGKSDGLFLYQLDGRVYRLDVDSDPVSFNLPMSDNVDRIDDYVQVNDSLKFWIRGNRELMSLFHGRMYQLKVAGERFFEFRNLHVVDAKNGIIGLSGGFLVYSFGPPRGYSFNNDQPAALGAFRVRRKIISIDDQQQILLGNPGFIFRQNNEFIVIPDRIQNSTYDGIVDGSAIFATNESDTLSKLDLQKKVISRLTPRGINASDKLFNIAKDSVEGTLVVGGEKAVFRYDLKRGVAIRHQVIGKSATRVIKRAPANGHWWVGTTDGLYELDAKLVAVRSFHKSAGQLQGITVSDLLFDGNDRLWIAHENGVELLDLRSGSVIDSVPADAFADPRVTAILKDGNGRLWLSTFEGLICFNPVTREVIRLGFEAGLINSEYNYQSAAVLPDGKLMFGGLGGYDVIDPVRYLNGADASGGKGVIAGYELIGSDGSRTNFILSTNPEVITFDTESEAVRIYLSTSQQINSSANKYEYRIDDGQWTVVDGTSYIEVQRFSPGSYTFEFRGHTTYGGLISFPSVKLVAQIVFYKSTLFLVMISGVFTALILVVVFLIRRGVTREKEIKENISMDLHDEVGTILTKAVLASRSGMSGASERVEEYLNEGLHSLRVFIDTMNKSAIPVETLVIEVRENIFPTLALARIEGEIEWNGDKSIRIPAALYRDLKLCIYECVNNALKYSEATRIDLIITLAGGWLEFNIADNGKLTDIETLEGKGGGISNLRKRARKHGGDISFHIGSGGHGLMVLLRIPVSGN